MINIAVIGCGYWGPKLIRDLHASENWNLKYACDLDWLQLKKIKAHYPTVEITDDCETLFKDNSLEAIVIATPVATHYSLAAKSLEASKHTWVEKPLTSTAREAEELINIAARKNLLLHVDHTYIYTPAVRKIKEIYDRGVLGEFYYFDSTRVNLGLFQHDVNVVWDLAPHDFSILRYVIGKEPKSVSAIGKSHIRYTDKQHENIAYITVNFKDDSIAHFHVNWLSPVKIRQILIGGSKKMLVFNDMEPVEKIKIYDAGVELQSREDVYNTLIQYRMGDMYSPKVENRQALQVECQHFYERVTEGRQTDTSGKDGLYVVRLLEAVDESIKSNGNVVKLS
jgi:predicted dehydrogenase